MKEEPNIYFDVHSHLKSSVDNKVPEKFKDNAKNKNFEENFDKTVTLRKANIADKVMRRKNIYDKSKPRRYVRKSFT